MAIRLSATLVAALLAFGVAGCAPPDVDRADAAEEYEFAGATSPGRLLPQGQRADAPAFSGELLDGTAFDSAELSGDVAVVNFWGSWCAPCRVETPDFQAVHTEFREQGIQFLGVDVKDERQLATAFMSNVGAEYPSLFDPRGEVALAFRGFPANVVPSTILLDSRGRVAAVYAGAVSHGNLQTALVGLVQEDEG